MDVSSFLKHPSFENVIDPKPYKGSGGPLDEILEAVGTGGFGDGLLFVCDPAELDPTFRNWVPSPTNPMVPFARTAFGDIFYAVVPPKGPPSPGILDVNYRTMRPAYASSLEDFFTRVLLMDEYRGHELREKTFERAKQVGTLGRTEMYAFTPMLALGGSEDGALDKCEWSVHLDLLLQATA